MDPIKQFELDRTENITQLSNKSYQSLGKNFVRETLDANYCYNFSWFGRPIIQFPQDMIAMQEIIWQVKPDLIIETGIAHGGSLIFYAAMLKLIGNGTVLGIDIDIREHNKNEIQNHFLSDRIEMFEGSSIEKSTLDYVKQRAEKAKKILVCLDSNHTYEHVLNELQMYSPLVSEDSYIVVFDTGIEEMPEDSFPNRPWGVGNSPQTALDEFLVNNKEFVVDKMITDKLLISAAKGGFLKRK